MQLVDPARHVGLTDSPWDEGEARRTIQEIVSDAESRFDRQTYWPAHPSEDGAPDGGASLYMGAVGVLWAIDFLKREGAAETRLALAPLLPGLLERMRAEYAQFAPRAGMEAERAAWLFGDPAVLLMGIRTGAVPGAADELERRIRQNLSLPPLELMWGDAGAMLTCRFASELTGEDRWRALYLELAKRLVANLEETPEGLTWTQRMYGGVHRFLGPVHGYAGNYQGLLAGWDWLEPHERARLAEGARSVLAAAVRRSELGANWHAFVVPDERSLLVQYCHGAPGMVFTFADPRIADETLTPLLEEAGELIWRAGPLAKGSNLCHGTAGNAFAFLKLHALTGEVSWLERARAFAMTAIAQCHAARGELGRGRYSLWTGDVGLACFLHELVSGVARFPTVDVF